MSLVSHPFPGINYKTFHFPRLMYILFLHIIFRLLLFQYVPIMIFLVWFLNLHCLVAYSCLNLCDPIDCSTPSFPILHHFPEHVQTELVIPSNHLILCHPLLLRSSIFASTRVFSNESAPPIRWPKYWSFSFKISPDWFPSGLTGWISLQSKGLSRVFSNTTV